MRQVGHLLESEGTILLAVRHLYVCLVVYLLANENYCHSGGYDAQLYVSLVVLSDISKCRADVGKDGH